jgi:phage gp45-like
MSQSWLQHSLENHDATLATLRRAAILKVDDTGAQQLLNLSGLASEQMQKIVRVLPLGFSSNPPLQAEGIFKSLGGRSDRGMFIGGEHPQYRQKNLPTGAAVLYDQNGNVIFASMQNGIQISAKTGKVFVKPAAGQNVYLGGTGSDGTYAMVSTVSGPAMNVLARIS